jgi:DNA-binding response OmpR family regulator
MKSENHSSQDKTLNHSIWILEDDPGCLFVYGEVLGSHYKTKTFSKLSELKDSTKNLTESEAPDLIIVDLALPDGNFLDLFESDDMDYLFNIPFMISSSSDEVNILKTCFDEGALDYLVKPFNKNELLVKVQRALSMTQNLKSKLNPIVSKIKEQLTRKEFDILETFLKSTDLTVSRTQLEKNIWKDVAVHPKALDVHMYNLRKKLIHFNVKIKLLGKSQWKLVGENIINNNQLADHQK